MSNVMKECCGLCPYSRKNTLFLSPDRAEEFAYAAENRYNDFVCHKTGVGLEDNESDDLGGSIVRGEKSLQCAGFHVMQHLIDGTESQSEVEIDIKDHFSDTWEMIEHHEENYNREWAS